MGYQELTPLANVKASHRAVMANNEFNVLFKEVEIDDSYSLEKFMEAEVDFDTLYIKLNLKRFNLRERNFKFRIRKIRGYRAGTYYPSYKTIVLHPNYMDSFVHELGHLLDYNVLPTYEKEWNGRVRTKQPIASESDAFKPLWDAYIENFKQSGGKGTHGGKYGVKYYTNSRETFARCFEWYVCNKFGDTLLTEPMVDYQLESKKAYFPAHNEELQKMVIEYFDGMFMQAV